MIGPQGDWIDWPAIQKGLVDGATLGLVSTLEYVEARARHYAPVRALFRRTRRGKEMAGGRGLGAVMAHYRATFNGGKSAWTSGSQASFRKSLARNRQLIRPEADTELGGKRTYRGQPNSAMPVFRSKVDGQSRVTAGNFRRTRQGFVGPGAPLAPVHSFQSQGGTVTNATRSAPGIVSGRGRYEVKSGRANIIPTTHGKFKPVGGRFVRESRDFKMQAHIHGRPTKVMNRSQVGGHLRDSIDIIPPSGMVNGTVWGSVVAMADYARWQEFGTSHNRASPFMRPALYEARRVFVARVRRGLGNVRFGNLAVQPSRG